MPVVHGDLHSCSATDVVWCFAERQHMRIMNHVRFADYWYTANTHFRDLKDFTSEIAASNGPQSVVLMDNKGNLKWQVAVDNDDLMDFLYPSIADMDGDGFAEIIAGRNIISHDGRLLGTGEPRYEAMWRALAASHPGVVAVRVGFDEALAHQIEGGADMFLMPSRFEPCGLSQLCGLRYGTLPVVARVGGLADTVIDANEAALADGVATGFQFSPVDHDNMKAVIDRTCDLWADRVEFTRVVRRAMGRNVGWARAAADYQGLYERLLSGTVG